MLQHRLPLLLALFVLAPLVRADGLIIISDGRSVPGHFPFAPLEVSYHHVDVTIDGPSAVTKVDQEFYNPDGRRLEGTYMFPLPDGASIDKFSMDIDGKQVEAELLSADNARSIYEDIVRKSRDPALLEYVGKGALKCRVFPIEPHSKKRIKLRYTQPLKPDGGIIEYTYPLNTEKFSSRPIKNVSIKVNVKSELPLKSIYSPSHDVEIKRASDSHAIVGFEALDVRPDTDFKLIFTHDPKASVGVSVLTYRRPGEDGYFLVMASPGLAKNTKPQPKDICFVIDTSGSMGEARGKKLEQAKKALSFCLANLNPEDRFEIVRFSTEGEPLFNTLVDATKEDIDKAQTFIDSFKPIGGTAIGDALSKSLDARPRDSKRPYHLIFLTDGQPTLGETNEDKLVDIVKKHGDARVHIFPFGLGSDVNTTLLDRIANDTHSFSQYVLPEEDLEVKLSSFYSKIQSPALTDVKLKAVIAGTRVDDSSRVEPMSDVKLKQLYPDRMPDLFAGQTLLVFGRYTGSGEGRIDVTGTRNGEEEHYGVAANFPDKDDTHAFIARLWATRRVGWLLDEIRMHGESSELKDEAVKLAREHGIVTPYTSYLIIEDESRRNVPVTLRTFRELETDSVSNGRLKDYYESAAQGARQEKAGDRAVANAQAVGGLRQSINGAQSVNGLAMSKSAPAPATQSGYRATQNFAQQVRQVNGKTFYQNGSTWSDGDVQSKSNLKRRQIKFNSDDYFALLKKDPAIPSWLSLGSQLDVVVDEVIYEIR